tara:strand:+ start:13731 stop:14060 length:330 start_codon:yes stop_codon:yes gene_type:complete
MGIDNGNKNKEKDIEKGFFSIFVTSFTTIFIAELGDKTQLATLMLSAESGKPLIVFIGSSFALLCSSIVGVIIGKWISSKITKGKFLLFTGILMTLISIWIGYNIYMIY